MEILSLLFMSYQSTRDTKGRCMIIKMHHCQWVYKPQQIACNLTYIISMHSSVQKLKEAKICKGIPNFHQVHLLFSTSAPRPKLPSFFVDLSVKRNKNEVRTKAIHTKTQFRSLVEASITLVHYCSKPQLDPHECTRLLRQQRYTENINTKENLYQTSWNPW
jgi:hypothetical protein